MSEDFLLVWDTNACEVEEDSHRIGIGSVVTPKSPDGLWLADGPYNGECQIMAAVMFKGRGDVVAVNDVVIDYNTWRYAGLGIGKVLPYRNCLIRCDNGIGWTGEMRLISLKS